MEGRKDRTRNARQFKAAGILAAHFFSKKSAAVHWGYTLQAEISPATVSGLFSSDVK